MDRHRSSSAAIRGLYSEEGAERMMEKERGGIENNEGMVRAHEHRRCCHHHSLKHYHDVNEKAHTIHEHRHRHRHRCHHHRETLDHHAKNNTEVRRRREIEENPLVTVDDFIEWYGTASHKDHTRFWESVPEFFSIPRSRLHSRASQGNDFATKLSSFVSKLKSGIKDYNNAPDENGLSIIFQEMKKQMKKRREKRITQKQEEDKRILKSMISNPTPLDPRDLTFAVESRSDSLSRKSLQSQLMFSHKAIDNRLREADQRLPKSRYPNILPTAPSPPRDDLARSGLEKTWTPKSQSPRCEAFVRSATRRSHHHDENNLYGYTSSEDESSNEAEAYETDSLYSTDSEAGRDLHHYHRCPESPTSMLTSSRHPVPSSTHGSSNQPGLNDPAWCSRFSAWQHQEVASRFGNMTVEEKEKEKEKCKIQMTYGELLPELVEPPLSEHPAFRNDSWLTTSSEHHHRLNSSGEPWNVERLSALPAPLRNKEEERGRERK
ncbi:MAG: hypothetical protein M1834_006344 [Cirrosporium novae-zelandiae]|nr:MAG: hypothetical protein M1834_006344 [Cirrosporium novae-zelandiae]